MIAKYIMTDRCPIIFPDTFAHEKFIDFKPISAGQITIDKDKIVTTGYSLSLNLRSEENDNKLIAYAFDCK